MAQFQPFIALTDKTWFDFLASRATSGEVDEVNFWSPKAKIPMKRMRPGDPVFFRLKAPYNAIVGSGFFAHFSVLTLDEAWEYFTWKNGDTDKVQFLTRIGSYRKVDLFDPRTVREPLGCMILREARFWPEMQWLPWGEEMGWKRNLVRGQSETDPARARLLLNALRRSSELEAPEEFVDRFTLLDADERRIVEARCADRLGQGAFRARLLDAYGSRCAITGEHTVPVLDAAHIQPYLGPRSNHMQNGLVLTKEFHTLFDRGFVTVTPEHVVRVSAKLRAEWKNGHRYYPYDGRLLDHVPTREAHQPSKEALEWHGKRVFMS